MTVQTSQLALITSAFAAGMENNLVASKLVEWRVRGAKNRTSDPLNRWQYVERVRPRFNTRRTSGDVADISTRQSREYGSEIYTLNDSFTLDYDYADFEHIRDEDTALRDITRNEISQNAGEDVDADILRTLVQCGCNWVGTPGTNITTIETLMNGYVRLKQEGVPDNEIFAVLALEDMPGLATYLIETSTANTGSQESIIARFAMSDRLKMLAGLRVMFTQQLPILTTGTRNVTAAINGAAQGSDYKDVARSTTTNGNFLTQELDIDGLGAAATIADGEVLTIAGVNAWDNRKGASQGRLQEFRVVGAATADGSGAATVRIFPAIVVPNSSNTGDAGVNNAHATVSAVPADNAVVTFKGAASTEFLQRVVASKSAIRVETADLEDGASGENSKQRLKSVPLSVHGYRFTDGNTRRTALRFDGIYKPNVNAFGRYKSVRINGT